jgi:hypothetical protein
MYLLLIQPCSLASYLSSYKSQHLLPYFEAAVAEGGADMLRDQLLARCRAHVILPNKDKLIKSLLFVHLLRWV